MTTAIAGNISADVPTKTTTNPGWLTGLYWGATGLISLMMLFSCFAYLTDPKMAAGLRSLGFPSFFRVELGIAKGIGALTLILPWAPNRLKEWAYAGFTITFVSALITHLSLGQGPSAFMPPVVALVVLMGSYYAFRKRTA